ncbi:MAG: CsbD family protein [Actinomycetota bacterium]
MNDLKAEGKWDQVKGRVKEAWGALSDDDLDRTNGKLDQLVGTIKEKTGEAVDTIEDKLNKILDRVR